MNGVNYIELINSRLSKILIKAARDAEKTIGLSTSNGINKRSMVICKYNSDVLKIMNELKELYKSGTSNCSPTVRGLKKNLRILQRLSIFNKDKNDSIKLDGLIEVKNNVFWSKINKFRKNSKKRVIIESQKPSIDDFINYFKNHFSHEDRPSNQSHQLIEKEVMDYTESMKNKTGLYKFNEITICEAINKLKSGKAPGFNLTNEFIKYGNCDKMLSILFKFYNNIVSTGHIPVNFNTSILIPIPKKGILNSPSDYRPISISSPLTTILEILLLDTLPCLKHTNSKQFGYKNNTSCKNAFYIANEVINYYKHGDTNVHVVSLDAAKAFDKVWREGLFFKLKDRSDPFIWRLLVNYYTSSNIAISVDGYKSEIFKTSQGLKQGGILSPFLFNFFYR